MKPGIESSKGLIVINFTLDDCPRCEMIKSTIEPLKIKYHGKVEFHEIKAMVKGKYDPLAEKYDIKSAPTVMIFRDGIPEFKAVETNGPHIAMALDNLMEEDEMKAEVKKELDKEEKK